jgi:hypothetical protein
LASGHQPMVSGASCGSQFSTPDSALSVPAMGNFWGAHRVVTCEGPVLWVNFSAGDTSRTVEITAGSLHSHSSGASAGRFADLRVDALVVAAGLPVLDPGALEIQVPSHATNGVLLQSPLDVSSCSHSQNLAAGGWAQVDEGVCAFGDSFGTAYVFSAVLLDRQVQVEGEGLVAFWFRGLRTGKLWVMVGSQPSAGEGQEDLFGQQRIPTGECNCLTPRERIDVDTFSGSTDFWELDTTLRKLYLWSRSVLLRPPRRLPVSCLRPRLLSRVVAAAEAAAGEAA